MALPGVLVLDGAAFTTYEQEADSIERWTKLITGDMLTGIRMIIIADDAGFTADTINNLVWVAFTRSNPAYDIYGVDSFTRFKHWGCNGPLIIDARTKPHHAPALIKDAAVELRVDRLGEKGASLHGII